jgi:DNA-binding GntR family transcriptional regulator
MSDMQGYPKLSKPQSLTDAVVAYIRDAVINGRFEPGQQLTEASLAQTLGTSRGTIREAMRVLAHLGLISLTAHRGASVTMLTAERAYEIYTMRALLESYAARMAAEGGCLDEAAMAMLEGRNAELVAAARAPDVAAMVEADIQFHHTLSELSGHRLLVEHLTEIQTHSLRFLIYSDLYRPGAAEMASRHADLLETIRTRDPDAIERAVRDHVTEVGRDVVTKLNASQSSALDTGENGERDPDPLVAVHLDQGGLLSPTGSARLRDG